VRTGGREAKVQDEQESVAVRSNSFLDSGLGVSRMTEHENTMMWKQLRAEDEISAGEVLVRVYQALKEKGHNPINQIVGYLLSGDPAYITSHGGARSLVRKVERDELLAELVKSYLADK